MSEGILNTQVDGTTIQAQHVNQYKAALVEDFLPRNLSGTNEDEGGSLGSDIYRWLKAVISTVFTNKLSIGAAGNEATNPYLNNSSNSLFCNVITTKSISLKAGSTVSLSTGETQTTISTTSGTSAVFDSNGMNGAYLTNLSIDSSKLGSGSVTETKIGTGAVTENKIGSGAVTSGKVGSQAVGYSNLGAITDASSSFATTNNATTTYTSAGQATVSAVTHRGVLCLAKFNAGSITSTDAGGQVRLYNTTTSSELNEVSVTSTGGITSLTGFDSAPASGNNVYQMQIRNNTGGTTTATNAALTAILL